MTIDVPLFVAADDVFLPDRAHLGRALDVDFVPDLGEILHLELEQRAFV